MNIFRCIVQPQLGPWAGRRITLNIFAESPEHAFGHPIVIQRPQPQLSTQPPSQLRPAANHRSPTPAHHAP